MKQITNLKAPIKRNTHIKDIYLHMTIIMEYHAIIMVIGDPGDSHLTTVHIEVLVLMETPTTLTSIYDYI